MIRQNNSLFLKLQYLYDKISIHDIYERITFEFVDLPLKAYDDKHIRNVTNELNGKFCSKNVIRFFKDCKKCMKVVYNSGEITFYIFDKKDFMYMTKLLLLIKRAVITKQFLNINKPTNIFLILSTCKRYISSKALIDAQHINGGFTKITNGNQISIYVTRKEECDKVMIHELVHQCSYIHGDDFKSTHLNALKNHFNLHPNLILIPNEAIVELWAVLIYSAFISFEYGLSHNDILNIEKQHNYLQSLKIFEKQKDKLWYEYTNGYCYIIFKTILLQNLEKLEKNYTYNYSPDYIVSFLLNNKLQDKYNKNHDFFKTIRGDKSLRLTFLND